MFLINTYYSNEESLISSKVESDCKFDQIEGLVDNRAFRVSEI